MYSTRILAEPDRGTLDAFLLRHADTSMIIRGNLLAQGVVDRGGRFQGTYAGAFDAAGALRAVAAHFWNGNLFPAADDEPALIAALRAAVAASGRQVKGLVGPRWIVRCARSLLGLDAAPTQLAAEEGLYALSLSALRIPALLSEPNVEVRALLPSDRERLVGWYEAYDIEILGGASSPELTRRSEHDFERNASFGERVLLTRDGVPCATTGFNARLPDCVQIGGVYTPPEARGRGYARAAVAGSLIECRARGVTRAILFTGEDNLAAITAYRALGFERIGDWNLTLFR